MKDKYKGIAKKGEQNKSEYDKILETNYEMGIEYYKDVENKEKQMKKENN